MAGISDRLGDALGQAVEGRLEREICGASLPNHIAIIMDGNRRFALQQTLPTRFGHRKGKEKLEQVMDWTLELGIDYLTVYALSSENLLARTNEELEELFNLYEEGLLELAEDERIHQNQVKVRAIGRLELLPERVQKAISFAEERTKEYNGFNFTICLAYGSREEMVGAIKEIARQYAGGDVSIDDIDEEMVSRHLYTGSLPDPDLIIRTSGEERISNFLLWQVAYSELYFTDVFWPSFSRKDFLKAIKTYQMRQRRHGK